MAQSFTGFERVGLPGSVLRATDLAFDGDTLYATFDRVNRRVLGDPDWTTGWEVWAGDKPGPGGDLSFDPDGTIYRERRLTNFSWSENRGETWRHNETPAITLPHHAADGSLVTSWNVNGYGAARSEDDGQTWTPIPYLYSNINDSAIPFEFVSIPPGASGPEGRIVAVGKPSFAYSDDFGRTWSEVVEVDGQPYSIFASSLIWVESGGFLLASALEATPSGARDGVFRSEDGQTWTRISQVFEDGVQAILVGSAEGALVAWEGERDRVAMSTDGGETWTLMTQSVTGDDEMRISDLEIGPDGHVYVAASGPMSTGGLWRSLDAVAVAHDPSRLNIPDPLGLVVYPNPAQNQVQVVGTGFDHQTLVSILDIQGRLVVTGTLYSNSRWVVDVSDWPSGTYLVRAGTAGASTTGTLTVQN